MIRKRRLADLICENDVDTDITRTSLPKAQMLFWTVLMLYLFVVKSIADGELWKVPWEMVAMMGMSQAAYLSPHLPGVRKKNPVKCLILLILQIRKKNHEPMPDRRK
ncbi:MAG: hypothetical protein HC887_01250 [Desulfobacteraceae bacterium]|nr:hypothetical protein [Desulfobacteraceae bacterium]